MSNSDNISRSDIIKKYGFEHFSDEFKTNFSKWFKGKDGVSEDIIQTRWQAVEAYPALAYSIYSNRKIRQAVEKKKPLAPVLARHYHIGEKNIKRVQGKSNEDLVFILYDVFQLEEKYFQQFKNNLPDLKMLKEYAECIYNMSIHKFLDYLSLLGHPCQYIEKMKENNIPDVYDAFHFLREKLFLPAILNKVKSHAEKNNLIFDWDVNSLSYDSKRLLIEQTNIKTILDFSERYHRNLFRWEDMFNFDSKIDFISWMPMFAEIDLGNGWIAREINSVAALKDQGRRENHCVGGYAKSILERDDDSARLIFSLEKNGEIKSTIDILCHKNESKDGLDVKIQQNRAHSNKNPCPEILDFSNRLIKSIKKHSNDKLETYLHNINDARKEYQKYQTHNFYIHECGYNPWNRDILEMVWNEFKPILPRKLRRSGLDAFIDMIPVAYITFYSRKNNNKLNPWDMMENKESIQIRDEANVEIVI